MTQVEREKLMVENYGEVCSKRQAARILHRAPNTINTMLGDGRLDAACEGEMVDVRSIARYIMAPKAEDEKARLKRVQARTGCKWSV